MAKRGSPIDLMIKMTTHGMMMEKDILDGVQLMGHPLEH